MKRNRTRAERTAGIPYDLTGDAQHREVGRTTSGRRRASEAAKKPSWLPPVGAVSDLPMLRTSERGTFKRCRWLWQLEYLRRLKPNIDTPPLMFGSMIHIALAQYYKPGIRRGPHPVGLFEAAIEAEAARVAKLTKMKQHHVLDGWTDRVDLGIGMLTNYIDHYGKDDEWKVLASELPFKVAVKHPRDGVTPWFWYTGIIDLLMLNRRTDKKHIWDHKTAAAISTKHLALNDQSTSYWTYGVEALINARKLGPIEKIDGMLFNILRKAKLDERPFKLGNDGHKYFLNQDGQISLKQPAPYFLRHPIRRHSFEMEQTRSRVLAERLDMEAVAQEPERGAYKNPTEWTCKGCWAFDICELHEIGADFEALIEATTHTWDPYEAHEIYFGETR